MYVEIYGTTWCAACRQAKKICESNGIKYNYTDVDDISSLTKLEMRLGYKVKTVPQIFVEGEHLSDGFVGLQKLL